MADQRFITYETLDDGRIARIMLNRPEARNAQNRGMLVELHDAFLAAEADDQVRVVILGGMGPMFSAGHDMGSKASIEEMTPGPTVHPTRMVNGGTRVGAESLMLQEWHYYFENTRRWRNLRKITIAQVHGDVYSAGLMLMWACDLIVAADDVRFADVVGTRLGMCGVEYFAHPWEFGPRKTKELMLTGDAIDVHEVAVPLDQCRSRSEDRAGRRCIPGLHHHPVHHRIRTGRAGGGHLQVLPAPAPMEHQARRRIGLLLRDHGLRAQVVAHQAGGRVVLAPTAPVRAEVSGQRVLAPRGLTRRGDRRERRDGAIFLRVADA